MDLTSKEDNYSLNSHPGNIELRYEETELCIDRMLYNNCFCHFSDIAVSSDANENDSKQRFQWVRRMEYIERLPVSVAESVFSPGNAVYLASCI